MSPLALEFALGQKDEKMVKKSLEKKEFLYIGEGYLDPSPILAKQLKYAQMQTQKPPTHK